MHTHTTPVVDDDTARHLTIARVPLERASDHLEEFEYHPDAGPELRTEISEVSLLVLLALEELPQ